MPRSHTARAAIAVLALCGLSLAAAAALLVPAGLPYDEPAHWSNVLFYASHAGLPVLGDPGVQYEGQQTPLYYALAAIIVHAVGSGEMGFTAVRLFGALGFAALTVLVGGVLLRTTRRQPVVVIAGTAFVALNPMLIVMSASVQNDTWALVAGFGAMLLAMATPGRHPWWRGIAIGVLGAGAIMVKLSIAPLVIAVVVVLLCRKRFAEAVASFAVVLVGCGWWLVRNLIVYGDLTGQAGVDGAGYRFGRGGLGPVALAREVVTYLTLPTEYLRNTISSPPWLDVVALLTGAAIVVGLVMLVIRWPTVVHTGPAVMVITVALVSVAAWLIQVLFGWQVAFRTAYGALPLAALAFGAASLVAPGRLSRIVTAGVLVALVLAMTVWTAIVVLQTPHSALLNP